MVVACYSAAGFVFGTVTAGECPLVIHRTACRRGDGAGHPGVQLGLRHVQRGGRVGALVAVSVIRL